MGKQSWLAALCAVFLYSSLRAQYNTEWNTGWKCQAISKVRDDGARVSEPDFPLKGWLKATVPGTVLTTLIHNHLEPDPFYGMNNRQIPDIYTIGRDYYTYWFVRDFADSGVRYRHEQVWLDFRGVNYSCDIWLNGHLLNAARHYGMYLRQSYQITRWLHRGAMNRLAVIVYPPDPVGNPNGGQGGDGEIARNVTQQYVAGWDWIQPVPDRNTGIWDKVTAYTTRSVRILDPHVVTIVPGIRYPDDTNQAPAVVRVDAELENTDTVPTDGEMTFTINGRSVHASVHLAPRERKSVQLPDLAVVNPRLWWPNGYGQHAMYHAGLDYLAVDHDYGGDGKTVMVRCDSVTLDFGIRQLTTSWNAVTGSRQLEVNGQKIFIKGGNWIVSDELLRFSPERYDAEIRFHRDMNLNLIRVWGGALTERPEFYDACDKYGILVFQDFWNSGDCNGRWEDPKKKDDQWTRRKYPDDHALFIASAADQIRLLRNHPSLAFWCGGNEITPPEDIYHALKDSLMPALDGTRYFFDYSNSDSMSQNTLGGNGDGPYGLQPISSFWAKRTFPFNSEVGSVGMGDYESLERFIPAADLVPPIYTGRGGGGGGRGWGGLDSVWQYHKYSGYDSSVYAYGPVKDLRDFANKAQLVNYDQYRALAEGFSSHMWDWYTGAIIWKTQNPWTALRGQMYDYYLDVNAGLYGLHTGNEPLHIMYDPVRGMTMIVNSGFRAYRDLMMQTRVFDMDGHERSLGQVFVDIGPTTVKNYSAIGRQIDALRKKEGLFLSLRLLDTARRIVSDNLYWLPDSAGVYSGLQRMGAAAVTADVRRISADTDGKHRVTVTLHNPPGGPVAFFIRLSLVDPVTHKRVLPVFYSDNYLAILPGESREIGMEYEPGQGEATPLLSVQGWNVPERFYPID